MHVGVSSARGRAYFPKENGWLPWFKGRVLEEEPTENGTESWVVFEDGGKLWLFLGNERKSGP